MAESTGSPWPDLAGRPIVHGAGFVGRDRECAALQERLEAAGRGEGGIVMLGGEPGIGKTRLLREFAAEARRRKFLVLSGRAYDMEGMPPYIPFVDVLREHVARSTDDALAALVSGAPEIGLLLPEVQERLPGLQRLQSLGPDLDRFRLFEAVSALLIGIARGTEAAGLVVLLDDLHWADKSTLLLLGHLARRLSGTALLVAGAYRTTDVESGQPLLGLLADLTRERLCHQILVSHLDEADTAALVAKLAGARVSSTFAMGLHRETAGNPFYVEELVRHLLEQGDDLSGGPVAVGRTTPPGVRQVLGQRLSRLSPAANEALRTASVLGEDFPFDLLAAASELGEAELIGAVEAAERAGMLVQEEDGYGFAHALVRQAIYDALSLPRRRHLHRRVAKAMESHNGRPGLSLAVVAHHWLQSGDAERAVGYLLRAGDDAIGLTAWEEAARHWEAALQCMEQAGQPAARQARLLEGLGDLYFLSTFEAHPSVERYVRASGLFESAGDPVGAARARSRAGRSLAYPTSGFDYSEALDHLRAAEMVLGGGPPGLELGELYAALAHAESHALRSGPEEMVAAMQRLGEMAEKLDNQYLRDLLCVQSLHLQGHYLGLQGHLAEGLALEELAFDTAAGLEDRGGAINEWPARWSEFLLSYSRDEEQQGPNDRGSFQFSRVHSRATMINMTTNCCGWQSFDLNDPVRAREKHQRVRDPQGRFLSPFLTADLSLSGDTSGLRQIIESGAISPLNPDAVANGQWMLAWAEGRWEEVRAGYAQRAGGSQQWGSNNLVILYGRRLLRVSRVTGDLEGAESILRASLAISLNSGAVKYEFFSRGELALLLAETGRVAEAEAHLVRCREILSAGEDWRGLGGRVSLAEGMFAAACGRANEFETHFGRAIECFRNLTLPWDEAEALELWAQAGRRWYRGHSRRAFVIEKLSSARSVYERIGAGQPWFDRLDGQQSGMVGAAVSGVTAAHPHGLSEREVEVLRLIARGNSNKQIAEELVLSVRTVERHIANVYVKIGASTKSQATAYAFGHNLS